MHGKQDFIIAIFLSHSFGSQYLFGLKYPPPLPPPPPLCDNPYFTVYTTRALFFSPLPSCVRHFSGSKQTYSAPKPHSSPHPQPQGQGSQGGWGLETTGLTSRGSSSTPNLSKDQHRFYPIMSPSGLNDLEVFPTLATELHNMAISIEQQVTLTCIRSHLPGKTCRGNSKWEFETCIVWKTTGPVELRFFFLICLLWSVVFVLSV